jgi:hypothetical protein
MLYIFFFPPFPSFKLGKEKFLYKLSEDIGSIFAFLDPGF